MEHPLSQNRTKVEQDIRDLAAHYTAELQAKIAARVEDMEADDNAHYLIYQVLGVSDEEGRRIDIYQNKGRFLYQYAGAFMERAAKRCFMERFPNASAFRIPNPYGQRPKTFEIDLLIDQKEALEIKWRDATTDGDHITKEHTRLRAIAQSGYKPVRVMFYYPNREQAIRIQQTLETLYAGVQGEYYYSDAAWDYIEQTTAVDLKAILQSIAKEN